MIDVRVYTPDAPDEKCNFVYSPSKSLPDLCLQITAEEKTKGPFRVTVTRRYASIPFGKEIPLISDCEVAVPKNERRSQRIALADLKEKKSTAAKGVLSKIAPGRRAQMLTVSVHDLDSGYSGKTTVLVVPFVQHFAAKALYVLLGIPIVQMYASFFDRLADDSGFSLTVRTLNFIFSSAFVSIIAKSLNRHGLPFWGLFSRIRVTLSVSAFLLLFAAFAPAHLLVRLHNTTTAPLVFAGSEEPLQGKMWKTMFTFRMPRLDKDAAEQFCATAPNDLLRKIAYNSNNSNNSDDIDFESFRCPSGVASEASAERWFDIKSISFQCRNNWETVPAKYLTHIPDKTCISDEKPDAPCLFKRRDDSCRLLETKVRLNFSPLSEVLETGGSFSSSAHLVTRLPLASTQNLRESGLLQLTIHDLGENELAWQLPPSEIADTSIISVHWSCDSDCRKQRKDDVAVFPIPMRAQFLKKLVLDVHKGIGGDISGTLSCRRTRFVNGLRLYPLRYEHMSVASISYSRKGVTSSYVKSPLNDNLGWLCVPDDDDTKKDDNKDGSENAGEAELVIAQSTSWQHPIVAFSKSEAPKRLEIVENGSRQGSVVCKDLSHCDKEVVFEQVDFKGTKDSHIAIELKQDMKDGATWTTEWMQDETVTSDNIWVCRCDNTGATKISAGAGFDVQMQKNHPERIERIIIQQAQPRCYFNAANESCRTNDRHQKEKCAPPVHVKGSRCPQGKEYYGCDC